MENCINFVVGYEEIDLGLGLNDSGQQKVLAPVIKAVNSDAFSNSMQKLLKKVSSAFDKCSLGDSQYTLGDIELSLTIGADGEVSILSAAVGASAEAAIKVTLKRNI